MVVHSSECILQAFDNVSIASSFSSFNRIISSFASRFVDISGVELVSPSWFEVGLKVKVEPLGFLQFFDVRMGGEVSSEEEDRTLFFSNIFCIVSAMKGREM